MIINRKGVGSRSSTSSTSPTIINKKWVGGGEVDFAGLCFTANSAGSTITLGKSGAPSWTGSYSTNGSKWIPYTPGTTGAITLTNIGDKVYFKGTYSANNSTSKYLQFSMTGSIAASGNIMSFCNGDSFEEVTTLPYQYIFYSLFKGCASLVEAPKLPATTLNQYCYQRMFYGCTSLTKAPALPCTNLNWFSPYQEMFYGCTSLTEAPELPATILSSNCYQSMFQNCSSLIEAPELPATSVTVSSYQSMFAGCTSLKVAPTMTLYAGHNYGLSNMFSGCTSLKYIKLMGISNWIDIWFSNWVSGVPAGGKFVCGSTLPVEYGASRIPTGWEVVNPENDYLCFTANSAGSTVTLTKKGSPSWTGSYSTDKTTWTSYVPGTTGAITLASIGDKVYFKGTYSAAPNGSNYIRFTATGSIAASGNVMSLCSGDNFSSVTTIPYNSTFNYLFYKCAVLTTPPEFPATTLTYRCYDSTFQECTALSELPKLPSTTLATECYYNMFNRCNGLRSLSNFKLKAMTIPTGAYNALFRFCSGISKPCKLPATSLSEYCYQYMFQGCSSLQETPELPALSVPKSGYGSMFRDCTTITKMPELPATALYAAAYSNMFENCTSLTELTKFPALTYVGSQVYICMFKGCSALKKLPKLPTLALYAECYREMFANCRNIKISETKTGDYKNAYKVPFEGTATGYDQYTGWHTFEGTGGTYTGDLVINTTYYTSNEIV